MAKVECPECGGEDDLALVYEIEGEAFAPVRSFEISTTGVIVVGQLGRREDGDKEYVNTDMVDCAHCSWRGYLHLAKVVEPEGYEPPPRPGPGQLRLSKGE